MSQTTIKAVLFDLGETLIRYGKVDKIRAFGRGARGSYDLLRTLGYPARPYPLYFVENAIRLRWHTLKSHWTGRDFDVLALFQRVGARKGVSLERSQWEDLAWRWYEPLSKGVVIEPGTAETLGTLRGMGLKLGLLSNTFIPASCLDRHLAQLGLLEFLPIRVYSYQCPFRKPDPRIFQLAAERIGEQVGHILYVGDRLDWDIRPALRLGMPAALVPAYTNDGQTVPHGAWVVRRLSDLPSCIKGQGNFGGPPLAEE